MSSDDNKCNNINWDALKNNFMKLQELYDLQQARKIINWEDVCKSFPALQISLKNETKYPECHVFSNPSSNVMFMSSEK